MPSRAAREARLALMVPLMRNDVLAATNSLPRSSD
jgi:hypothetical protein